MTIDSHWSAIEVNIGLTSWRSSEGFGLSGEDAFGAIDVKIDIESVADDIVKDEIVNNLLSGPERESLNEILPLSFGKSSVLMVLTSTLQDVKRRELA